MNYFMNYYVRALKKYADFEGRDTRPQYWYFFLFNLIIYIILSIISVDILTSLYYLAVFIPSLAIAIRRLHDIGKSGWWVLIGIIPIIGWIWIIILLATKGEDKPNKYGSVPKTDKPEEVKVENKEEISNEKKEEPNQENKDLNQH